MDMYKDFYKTKRIPSLAETYAKRHQNLIAERIEKRRELFWSKRGCEEVPPEAKSDREKKKNTRAEMLQKWKEEKQRKLEETKKKQKPIFKVGVVQRKVTGSPIISQSKTYMKKTTVVKQMIKTKTEVNGMEKNEGVVTRSKAKMLTTNHCVAKPVLKAKKTKKTEKDNFNNKFCKIDTGKKKPVTSDVFKVPEAVSKLPYNGLTFPYSPKMSKRRKSVRTIDSKRESLVEDKPKELSVTVDEKREETPQKENVDPVKSTTPENKISDSDGFVPIHYSPFVTVRKSGRKSDKKAKRSLILNVDEQIEKEEKEFKCRIFSFRKYIECETKRLLDTCDKWKHIYQEFQEVPDEIEGDIDCIIGKTHLLTSDKFMQFKGLIDKCEKGDPLIKVDDLQGFQDWVSLEVERIDEDFLKLEKKKLNNWAVEVPAVGGKKVEKVKPKNGGKKPLGKSNIRSHILAARKLLKEKNADGADALGISFGEILKITTPKKPTLLKEVLTSETKKKMEFPVRVGKSPIPRERRNSGLEIMIATQKNKLPTPVKVSPKAVNYEIFVSSEQTPNRSILKKTPRSLNSSKSRVTFKKITENDSNGRGLDEKYFQPVTDDDWSPARTVLGDIDNLTPSGMRTRSRSKRFSVTS